MSILYWINSRSSQGGHGRFRWSATAGSNGLGAGLVVSTGMACVEDVWPGMVGVGDEALATPGSRSSESASKQV